MNVNLSEQWENEGYVVLRGLFDSQRSATLLKICDAILDQWRVNNPEKGTPGGGPDATVMRHLNHPGYFTEQRAGLSDILDAVADPQVLDIARNILGDEPLFRCTSFFFNPLADGRDGNWHRDSQFSAANDEEEKATIAKLIRSGTSIQMQIPLVPSADIEYVPNSHIRWDTPEEYAIRRADGGKNNRSNAMPGALRLALEPGDAALFNPYGIHRGRYHTTPLRRTLMLTYTKSSETHSDYFSNQPWFLEPGYLDGLKPETRAFLDRFVDQYTPFWQEKLAETVKA
ncbi:MAG: phytanoyl-CoA dioxygenase family protein [Chloroflexi bacterium]|nr:phytanoyl-CoA dioxygenase family protein [Chloroflexota bacterium]